MQQNGLFVGALAVLLAACGDATPVNTSDVEDGGQDVTVPCINDSDCGEGRRCSLGVCVDASCKRDSDCISRSCDLLRGVCRPPADAGPGGGADAGPSDGGAGPGDGGPSDGGATGKSCINKYECDAGKICKNQVCTDPAADLKCIRDADCPRGTICNSSTNKCEIGCADQRDCENNPQGPVCDMSISPTYKCAKCDPVENPCPSGQACVDQACTPATTCVNNDPCGDLVCTPAGICGNCTGDAQCGPGKSCLAGRCSTTVSGCTSDDDCKSQLGNPKAYCNNATPRSCAVGQCTDDTHCNITAGEVCNLSTHTCQTGGPGGGGQSCMSDADCGPGGACMTDGTSNFCAAICDYSTLCLCANNYVCAVCDSGICLPLPQPLDMLACMFLGSSGVCLPP